MLHETEAMKKQGYYYEVTTIWTTAPDKIFKKEYGNEASAKKATDHWNKYPDCKSEYRKIDL